MKVVQLSQTGGPEVLDYVERPMPEPDGTDVVVRAEAIGVSMPEMLVRNGSYAWMPPLPAVLGIEMAGRISAVGSGVRHLTVGDAVFVSARELPVRGGCYAEYLKADAAAVYLLPEGTDLDAAACLSNYQVAWHLLNSATKGFQFDSVLVWAAAGGVGTAVVQLARLAGKKVIGLASGTDRCDFVLAQGAHACIDYKTQDIGQAVGDLMAGRGVDLILDCVGGPRFGRNFAWLAPLGMVINYGLLEGSPDAAFAPAMLARFGDSVGLRYFSMHTFDNQPAQRRAAMDALVPLLIKGLIKPPIFDKIPLREVRRAHALFESGKVLGKLLMTP